MATTKHHPLTVADIEAGYEDERWLGWGYLQGRQGESQARVSAADAIVLRQANEQRWTAEDLFQWLNSRPGRHFADWAFGSGHAAISESDMRDGDRTYFFQRITAES